MDMLDAPHNRVDSMERQRPNPGSRARFSAASSMRPSFGAITRSLASIGPNLSAASPSNAGHAANPVSADVQGPGFSVAQQLCE